MRRRDWRETTRSSGRFIDSIDTWGKVAGGLVLVIDLFVRVQGYLPSFPGVWLHVCVASVWTILVILLLRKKPAKPIGRITRKRKLYYTGKVRMYITGLVFIIPMAIMAWTVGQSLRSMKKDFRIVIARLDSSDVLDRQGFMYEIKNRFSYLEDSTNDIEVVYIDEIIEVQEGSEKARKIGYNYKADIVIWGTYRTPGIDTENAEVVMNLNIVHVSNRIQNT